jgi:hypothetical protein
MNAWAGERRAGEAGTGGTGARGCAGAGRRVGWPTLSDSPSPGMTLMLLALAPAKLALRPAMAALLKAGRPAPVLAVAWAAPRAACCAIMAWYCWARAICSGVRAVTALGATATGRTAGATRGAATGATGVAAAMVGAIMPAGGAASRADGSEGVGSGRVTVTVAALAKAAPAGEVGGRAWEGVRSGRVVLLVRCGVGPQKVFSASAGGLGRAPAVRERHCIGLCNAPLTQQRQADDAASRHGRREGWVE